MACPFRTVLTTLAIMAGSMLIILEFFWDKKTINDSIDEAVETSHEKSQTNQDSNVQEVAKKVPSGCPFASMFAAGKMPSGEAAVCPVSKMFYNSKTKSFEKLSDEVQTPSQDATNVQRKLTSPTLKQSISRFCNSISSLSPSLILFSNGTESPKFSQRSKMFRILYISCVTILVIAHIELITVGSTSKILRQSYKSGTITPITDAFYTVGKYIYVSFQPLIDTVEGFFR